MAAQPMGLGGGIQATLKMNILKKLLQKRPEPPEILPLRTHGLATFWYNHGCPNTVGQEIEVEMISGKRAVFKVSKITRPRGVDWNWYDFDFVKYL